MSPAEPERAPPPAAKKPQASRSKAAIAARVRKDAAKKQIATKQLSRRKRQAEAREAKEKLRLARDLERRIEQVRAQQQAELIGRIGGTLPTDPLEILEESFNLIAYTQRFCAIDPKMNPQEQRAELRQIAKTLQALIPDTRRLQAERMVRQARGEIDQPVASPKLEAPPKGSVGPMQMAPRKT